MNLLTHQFETSKCRLLAINLPEGDEYKLFNDYSVNENWISYLSYNIGVDTFRHYLPPGDWEILEVTEEKAREVVDFHSLDSGNLYYNYTGDNFHTTALESFESLIAASIKTVNKYGEKPDFVKSGLNVNGFSLLISRWQSEQATVFDNYIILISKKQKDGK